MARPTKLSDAVRDLACEALRAGNTRAAACARAGISDESFSRYLKRDAAFAEAVRDAEAGAERDLVDVIRRAADGVPTKSVRRNVHDVVKTRKTRRPLVQMQTTRYPDGRVVEHPVKMGEEVVEEPVTVTLRSAQTQEGVESDWHAALELLKRRFRLRWGDRAQVDLRSMTDEEILAVLAADGEGEAPGGGA